MSLLGGIGEALSAYSKTDLDMKHSADERKRQQQQLQLQGLQSLLGQNDLPMETYAHAIGALAELTGNKATKQVADHLYEQLGQQLPVQTVNPQPAPVGSQAGRIEVNIGPPPSMTQVTHETVGQMPRNVYNDRMSMPADVEKFRQQKQILEEMDRANDQRTQERQLAVQKLRGEQALARLPIQLENRLKVVGETYKLKARQDVDKLIAGGMDAEGATEYVLAKAAQDRALRDARIAVTQATANAIPARVEQGWANLEVAQLRAQIAQEAATTKADMGAFDRQSKWAFEDLDSINQEINSLEKRPDLLNGTDPSWKNQLQSLKGQKDALLNQIWTLKGQYVPSEAGAKRGLTAPPSRSGTRRGQAMLTEAEIRAAGGSDADIAEARRKGRLAQ